MSLDTLVQIGRIETKLIDQRIGYSPIKYQNLKHFFVKKITVSLFWLLKPKQSFWNGFMEMVHTGSYPGKSSVAFMTMIDWLIQQCISLLAKQINTMLTQY